MEKKKENKQTRKQAKKPVKIVNKSELGVWKNPKLHG